MLKKFSVSNFKQFQDRLCLDLSDIEDYDFSCEAIKHKIVNKAIVYGFNGSGKSNLGLAIMDIVIHLTDYHNSTRDYLPYLNLCGLDKSAKFEYEFCFNEGNVVYQYEKKNVEELLFEKLIINNKVVLEFDYSKKEGYVNLSGAETLDLITGNSNISRVKYIKSNTLLSENDIYNKLFNEFIDFVNKMLLFYSLKVNRYIGFDNGRKNISKGIIDNGVENFEKFLKEMGIPLKISEGDLDGEPALMVDFVVNNKKTRVSFGQIASTGTKALASFYYWYIRLKDVKFAFIDEFDAFYHFELSEEIVRKIINLTDIQVIFTTHNTNLLSNDLLRPDCYFYLNEGKIKSLSRCTEKDLQKAHNLQRMFKAGAFND